MLNSNRRVSPVQDLSTRRQRWMQALVLSVALGASGWAMALPTPQDIQASVQSGRLDQAESQLREVLQAKPNSAKAHYELGEVLAREGRYIEAQQELREAQREEPSLKFASSPQKFQDLQEKVNAKAAPAASSPAVRAAVPAALQPMPVREPSGLPWGIIALAVVGLMLLVTWMRRAAAANAVMTQPMPMTSPMGGSGYGANYNPTPGYGPMPTAGGGSTMTGAVVGGLAGVAAGYALSKAMEGRTEVVHDAYPAAGSGGYVPYDGPAAAPDFGNFDPGAGQGWDNADGGDFGGGGSNDW